MDKKYKKVTYAWVGLLILLIIGAVIAVLSSDTDKARVWVIIIESVMIVATLIIHTFLIIQLERDIKRGL